MQTFKIQNYEREHGLQAFPPFRHLAAAETVLIREALRKRLKLPEGILPKDILQTVHDRGVALGGANAEDDQFDLRAWLDQLGFAPSEVTYLNWDHFDDMDEILTMDLARCFSDIWYPVTDDLELIDSRMQWVMCVYHYGAVKYLNLGEC